MSDKEAQATKNKARKWWADFQKKGEKQMLIEGVALGDGHSLYQGSRLIKKYPDVAYETLVKALPKSENWGNRASFIWLLDEVKDKRVHDFLRGECHGPDLDARVAAANCLTQRGDEEGFKTVLREWEELGKIKDFDSLWGKCGPSNIILALCRSGKLSAYQALAKDLKKRPVGWRMEVMQGLESYLDEIKP